MPTMSQPIVEAFTLGPYATNCFLVHHGHDSEAWIVDASFQPASMIERARQLGARVTRILLTHAHLDHIAGLAEVKAAFPEATIAIHDAEREFLTNPDLNLSGGAGVPFVAPPADLSLEHGQKLNLDGDEFTVLHTPGHSPGGVTLHCPAERLAIVGDTLFFEGVGRYDFPTSDQSALFNSIQRILYALPDETRCLPGHGPETTIGHEKRLNPFVRAQK